MNLRKLFFLSFLFFGSFVLKANDTIQAPLTLDTIYIVINGDTVGDYVVNNPDFKGIGDIAINLDELKTEGEEIVKTSKEKYNGDWRSILMIILELVGSGVLISFIRRSTETFDKIKVLVSNIKGRYLLSGIALIVAVIYELSTKGFDDFSFMSLLLSTFLSVFSAIGVFELILKDLKWFKKEENIELSKEV